MEGNNNGGYSETDFEGAHNVAARHSAEQHPYPPPPPPPEEEDDRYVEFHHLVLI